MKCGGCSNEQLLLNTLAWRISHHICSSECARINSLIISGNVCCSDEQLSQFYVICNIAYFPNSIIKHHTKYIIIWQVPLSSLCYGSHSLRESEQLLTNLSEQLWAEQLHTYMDISPALRRGHQTHYIIQITYYYYYYYYLFINLFITCVAYFTLLIRDFVLLSLDWQQ